MSPRCIFVHERTDAPFAALEEHAACCPDCARALLLRAAARATWRRAEARDEASLAVARERRVRARGCDGRTGRARAAGPAVALVLGGALFAATAAAVVVKSRAPEPEQGETAVVRRPRAIASARAREMVTVPTATATAIPTATATPTATPTPTPTAMGAVVRRAAPATVGADDGEALWRAAEDSLLRGDRAGAERSLAALLASPREPSLTTKAELRIGELLLARGAAGEAGRHLAPLVASADPGVAEEAVWLYVRSRQGPRDRVAAWDRYLGTGPRGAAREVAAVERARAVFEAGDVDAARASVKAMSEGIRTPVGARALHALEAQLGVESGP